MAATEILREYLIKLGYKIDQTTAKKFDDSIAESTKLVAGFAAGVEAAAAVAVAGFARMADGLDKLYFLAKRSQSSVEGIEELQYAFGQLGSSAGAAQSAVANLNRFLQTSPGARGFLESFGVQTRDANGNLLQTNQLLNNTAQTLRKMPMYMALARGAAMGLGYEDVQTLRMSGLEQFEAQHASWMKAAGVDAKRAADAANQFSTALRGLYDIFGILQQRIVQDLGSGFTTAITKFRDLILSHMDMITNGIRYFSEGVLAAATVITRLLFRIGQAFDELSPAGKRLVEVFGALLVAWRVLNAGWIASPIGAIVAGLTTLLLLFDDFKAQQAGGKSLVDWGKLLPAVDSYIEPIRAAFGNFKDFLVNSVWPDVREQTRLFLGSDLQEFVRSVPPALEGISHAFAGLDTAIKGFTGGSSLGLGDLTNFLNRVNAAAGEMGDQVHRALVPVVDFINKEMLLAITAVNDAMHAVISFLKGDWTTAWGDSINVLRDLFGTIDDAIAAIRNAAPTLANKLFGAPANAGEAEALARAQAVPGQGPAAFHEGQDPGPQIDYASAVKFFMNKGLPYYKAVGLVTNLQAESGLHIGSVGDHGQAYGIAQWHPDRVAAIEGQFGKKINQFSAEDQMNAVWWEMTQGGERKAGQALFNAPNDPRIAGEIVSRDYERPRDVEREAASRGNMAFINARGGVAASTPVSRFLGYSPDTRNRPTPSDFIPPDAGPRRDRLPNLIPTPLGQDYFSINPPLAPAANTNNVSVNQNNTFNVSGVGSPQSVAGEILNGQRRVAADLARNVTGVVR